MHRYKLLCGTLLFCACGWVHAQARTSEVAAEPPAAIATGKQSGVAKILRPVWAALGEAERASIQQRYVADLQDASGYGLVIDNQGVDVSTPGTTSGAQLGSAVANAAYIDRAFSPSHNYSAKTQLAVGLLGAIVGSALDRPAVRQYHFRYALKLRDGEIAYRDIVQGEPFRHPAGICLDLRSLTPAPQTLCTQTVADVRKTYLEGLASGVLSSVAVQAPAISDAAVPPVPQPVSAPPADRVDCKVGNLAPISTTPDKCNAIGGRPL